ncbi:hypothetical protein Pyn_25176 [Prunus yedoensis var. nudiflora]|uniref:Uncharacterized protein n=1 Tax=Prunus yedoensis var. nudiflora TaxID=2094558 RepID=A0A314UDV6_PRUYE|nr:hypothetical protein Pyn_25176 [Prunus yedoensis var. nudiflora]
MTRTHTQIFTPRNQIITVTATTHHTHCRLCYCTLRRLREEDDDIFEGIFVISQPRGTHLSPKHKIWGFFWW